MDVPLLISSSRRLASKDTPEMADKNMDSTCRVRWYVNETWNEMGLGLTWL